MLNQQIYSNIRCAIPHQCAKQEDNSNKCAQCEIAYSFIACEPILMQCMHHVCKECTVKIKKGSAKCKFCSADLKSTGVQNPTTEILIKTFFTSLSKNLRDKYMGALHLFESNYLVLGFISYYM
jgi:hypothetical protein